MKKDEKTSPFNLLNGFLDDTLSPQQRKIVEKAIETDSEIAAEIELQGRIDKSLRKIYAPPKAPTFDFAAIKAAAEAPAVDGSDAIFDSSHHDLSTSLERSDRSSGRSTSQPRMRFARVVVAALAATTIWGFFGVQLFRNGGTEIAFQRRPLVEVYQECVDGGFQPYWVCDNEKLFASTFEKRQGVALKLAEMPADTKMVGLAYLAGLSRQSTSLLAEVDGTQVIVFVDRSGNDTEIQSGVSDETGLNIFKMQKDGLVFYEVSPLEEPEVVDFLVKAAD